MVRPAMQSIVRRRAFRAPHHEGKECDKSDLLATAKPLNGRSLPHLGPYAVKIERPDALTLQTSSCGGDSRCAQCEQGTTMNATRSEKIESTETDVADNNLAAVSEVEAGIRDFVRNDVAYLRRPAAGNESALDPSAEATVTNVNSLIQRVAGTSLAEIENLISELESLRDLLHAEGQRVQREISGYAQLSQAAMKSTRMISDNVAQWKRAADGLRNS
jgi:hypothetical protein